MIQLILVLFPFFPILVFLTAWNQIGVPNQMHKMKAKIYFLGFPNKCKGQNQTNAFLESEAYQFSCFPGSSSSAEKSLKNPPRGKKNQG